MQMLTTACSHLHIGFVLMIAAQLSMRVFGVQKPLAYSNVSLIDPVSQAPCRVSWRYLADGTKVSCVPCSAAHKRLHVQVLLLHCLAS